MRTSWSSTYADPVACSRDGRASLAKLQWQDFRWIYPDSRLETNGKCTLEHEQHGSGTGTTGFSDGSLVLDVPDQTSLADHNGGHHADHREKKWPSSNAID